MNLSEVRTIVRRDLHDEDASNYRWTDDEIDRHIAAAVKSYSEAIPCEQKTNKSTTPGSREIDISSLSDCIQVEAIEYPINKFPKQYQRFSLWGSTVTLLGEIVPDGSDIIIYYGQLHTLDINSSTIPTRHEDLIATGACGYAALEWAVYAVNHVNIGGTPTPGEFLKWGRDRLNFFRYELKKLGKNNRVRARSLYQPHSPLVSKSSDAGP
jgi:hypothetical protein